MIKAGRSENRKIPLKPAPGVSWGRKLFGVALPFIASAVQLAFWDSLRPLSFFLLYPAIFVSSWLGGFWVGLIATTEAVLLGWYFFVLPEKSFAILEASQIAQLITFTALGIMFSLANGRLLRAMHNAQAALEAREIFLSIASHELRTPLTAFQLHFELLKKEVTDDKSRESASLSIKRIESMDRQLRRFVRLIDNLLDVTRLRHEKMELQVSELDLVELAREAIHRLRDHPKAADIQVRLTVLKEPRIMGEKIRLEQILTNLLSNAHKYSHGDEIEIRIDADGSKARVSVIDQGVGLSTVDQKRVFNPFERVGTMTSASGLGLGLYISQEIARAHGGQILVESTPGRGSSFTLELPLKPN